MFNAYTVLMLKINFKLYKIQVKHAFYKLVEFFLYTKKFNLKMIVSNILDSIFIKLTKSKLADILPGTRCGVEMLSVYMATEFMQMTKSEKKVLL